MQLIYVGLGVLFSYWHNALFSALQQSNQSAFFRLILYFPIIILIVIVVAVYKTYFAQLFQLHWRRWLTNYFLGNYLAEHAYYGVSFKAIREDNPDQRISVDIASYVTHTCDLTIDAIQAVASFISHVFILWSLSGMIEIPVTQDISYKIRGGLMWLAIVYAGLGKKMLLSTRVYYLSVSIIHGGTSFLNDDIMKVRINGNLPNGNDGFRILGISLRFQIRFFQGDNRRFFGS
jgi:putative ATP-binding cassette transporter